MNYNFSKQLSLLFIIIILSSQVYSQTTVTYSEVTQVTVEEQIPLEDLSDEEKMDILTSSDIQYYDDESIKTIWDSMSNEDQVTFLNTASSQNIQGVWENLDSTEQAQLYNQEGTNFFSKLNQEQKEELLLNGNSTTSDNYYSDMTRYLGYMGYASTAEQDSFLESAYSNPQVWQRIQDLMEGTSSTEGVGDMSTKDNSFFNRYPSLSARFLYYDTGQTTTFDASIWQGETLSYTRYSTTPGDFALSNGNDDLSSDFWGISFRNSQITNVQRGSVNSDHIIITTPSGDIRVNGFLSSYQSTGILPTTHMQADFGYTSSNAGNTVTTPSTVTSQTPTQVASNTQPTTLTDNIGDTWTRQSDGTYTSTAPDGSVSRGIYDSTIGKIVVSTPIYDIDGNQIDSSLITVDVQTPAQTQVAANTQTPTAATSQTPVASNTQTPAAATSQTPVASNTQTPAATSQTTVASNTQTPAAATSQTTVASNTQTPTAATSQTTVASNTQTPTAANTQTPVASNTQTPTAATSQTTVASNTQTPTAASQTPAQVASNVQPTTLTDNIGNTWTRQSDGTYTSTAPDGSTVVASSSPTPTQSQGYASVILTSQDGTTTTLSQTTGDITSDNNQPAGNSDTAALGSAAVTGDNYYLTSPSSGLTTEVILDIPQGTLDEGDLAMGSSQDANWISISSDLGIVSTITTSLDNNGITTITLSQDNSDTIPYVSYLDSGSSPYYLTSPILGTSAEEIAQDNNIDLAANNVVAVDQYSISGIGSGLDNYYYDNLEFTSNSPASSYSIDALFGDIDSSDITVTWTTSSSSGPLIKNSVSGTSTSQFSTVLDSSGTKHALVTSSVLTGNTIYDSDISHLGLRTSGDSYSDSAILSFPREYLTYVITNQVTSNIEGELADVVYGTGYGGGRQIRFKGSVAISLTEPQLTSTTPSIAAVIFPLITGNFIFSSITGWSISGDEPFVDESPIDVVDEDYGIYITNITLLAPNAMIYYPSKNYYIYSSNYSTQFGNFTEKTLCLRNCNTNPDPNNINIYLSEDEEGIVAMGSMADMKIDYEGNSREIFDTNKMLFSKDSSDEYSSVLHAVANSSTEMPNSISTSSEENLLDSLNTEVTRAMPVTESTHQSREVYYMTGKLASFADLNDKAVFMDYSSSTSGNIDLNFFTYISENHRKLVLNRYSYNNIVEMYVRGDRDILLPMNTYVLVDGNVEYTLNTDLSIEPKVYDNQIYFRSPDETKELYGEIISSSS